MKKERLSKFSSVYSIVFLLASALLFQGCLMPEGAGAVDYKGLRLYRLVGKPKEIGYAAGILVPEEAREKGMVVYAKDFVYNLLASTSLFYNYPILKFLIEPYLGLNYYHHQKKKLTDEDYLYLKGFALGIGESLSNIRKMYLNPDTSVLLVADYWNEGLNSKALVSNLVSHPPGCTSAVYQSSDHGEFLYGRVFDYSGVGFYDRFPAIHFIAPEGKNKYITISSSGIMLAPITSMNEHGLTLALHTSFSSVVNKKGYPIFSTMRKMLEDARNIDEAVEICNQNPPAAGWLINLVDTWEGERRAARIETFPAKNKCLVEYSNKDYFVTTNHYSQEEAKSVALWFGPAVDSETKDRNKLVSSELEHFSSTRKEMEPQDMARILALRFDPLLGRPLAYAPSSVSKVDQQTAVIFNPEKMEFWVSNGKTPAASRGTYVHFKFSDFVQKDFESFKSTMESKDASKDMSIDDLLWGSDSHLDTWPEFKDYHAAYLALEAHKPILALSHFNKVVEKVPDEPLYRLIRGALRLKVGLFDDALFDLEKVLNDFTLDQHRRDLAALYYAQTLDVLDKHELALTYYNELVKDLKVDGRLRAAADHYAKNPLDASEAESISIDLKFADSFAY